MNITVEAVNDAPVVTAPEGVTVNEDSSVAITGISVFDVDLVQDPSLELQVTLTVANGTLTLGQTAGLTLPPGANGTAGMAFTGTLHDVNAALATLTYAPDANYHGADALQITVDDLGNSGKSAPIVVAQSVSINAYDVIDHIPPDEAGFAYPGTSGDFIPTVGQRVALGELSSLFSSGGVWPDDLTGTEGPGGSSPNLPELQTLFTGGTSSSQDHDNGGKESDIPLGLEDFMALLKHWGYADDFDDIRLVFNEGMIGLFESLTTQTDTSAEHEGQNVVGLHGFADLLASGKTLVFNLDELRIADMALPEPADLGSMLPEDRSNRPSKPQFKCSISATSILPRHWQADRRQLERQAFRLLRRTVSPSLARLLTTRFHKCGRIFFTRSEDPLTLTLSPGTGRGNSSCPLSLRERVRVRAQQRLRAGCAQYVTVFAKRCPKRARTEPGIPVRSAAGLWFDCGINHPVPSLDNPSVKEAFHDLIVCALVGAFEVKVHRFHEPRRCHQMIV